MFANKTCSAKCGYELRKTTTRKPRTCQHCGAKYTATAVDRVKFCSRKCYIAAVGSRPKTRAVECAQCGALVQRPHAAIKRVQHSFCGDECRRKFHRGANHYAYRGDKDPNRGAKWNRLADSIRHRDSYSCRRCGLCQNGNGKNGEKLSVDHVRPWRSFENKDEANHPDNLVSLCRPCHSYKTTVVEAAWLRGDVIAWRQWVASLHLQSAAEGLAEAFLRTHSHA